MDNEIIADLSLWKEINVNKAADIGTTMGEK